MNKPISKRNFLKLIIAISGTSIGSLLSHITHLERTKAFVASTTSYLPLIETFNDGWFTVAGNPERTSWIPEEVTGDTPSGTIKLAWYRPIEAYIPQNVQIIASNGVLYISTARGLYALDATSGALKWRFDTELPLGNSPTVSNGIVYLGGYDRQIHALDALSGSLLWSFTGAQAGFCTNPLVADGNVIAGNRDGYMYAIGAQGQPAQGQLVWKFQTGGPIVLSASHKDGIIYFASNDNYAYALRAVNGTQVWKSGKLPGDGYLSYWPVIYSDPITRSDKIIFSASSGYRWALDPGDQDIIPNEVDCLWPNLGQYDPIGPTVQVNEFWAQGKKVVDFSRVSEYFENNPNHDPALHKPWRRTYIVLNASDGSEFTYDSDHTGFPEYAPVGFWGTGSGAIYPPIIGSDRYLYQNNVYQRIGIGQIMGWRTGTQFMFRTEQGVGATAEPQALSGGGNLIYRSICCDRVGDWFDVTNNNRRGLLWQYGYPLSDLAPNYDQMWWFLSTELDRLYGNFGNVNGIYHNHGDQNPIVPHRGMLFIHRSNCIIAFGTGQIYGKQQRININQVKDNIVSPSIDQLKGLLETEIQKIVNAGHLRPGYYNAGQFNDIYYDLSSYFDNPGDTILALAKAYPYLSAGLQSQVKTYLSNEFNTYFNPVMYSTIGYKDGNGREAMPIPPEVTAAFSNFDKVQIASPAWSWQYPQYNFYAMWKYALIFPESVSQVYNLAKNSLEVPCPGTNDTFSKRPWENNGYIAGYIGFLNLQSLAGKSVVDGVLRTQVTNELNRLLQLRANNFTKDTYYTDVNQGYTHRTLNVARNFIMLVPELGDYLYQNALNKVQNAVDEYNYVGSYWFVSRYNASIAESTMQNLYDYAAMFQAKAWILKESRSELVKYLDVPAFERGDLFYINNLIAVIEAP